MWQSFVTIKSMCPGDIKKSPSTTAAENDGQRGHEGELMDEKGLQHTRENGDVQKS